MDNQDIETKQKAEQKSIWDEYIGQYVFVQFSEEYVAVANPGLFLTVQTPQGLQLVRTPLLEGIFNVKKDDLGNIRVILTIKDPNPEEEAVVRVDLDPKYIFSISLPQKQGHKEEKSLIQLS